VNADNIKAVMSKDVLKVTIPKPAPASASWIRPAPRHWPQPEPASFPPSFLDLIRINDRHRSAGNNIPRLRQGEVVMPFDALVMSAAVIAMFLVFAGVLLWGDAQTRPDRLKADADTKKRRSF
jgi:hypothetical protein